MDVRPPWQGTSMKPHDLEKSFHAFLTGVNPNDPKLPKSALVLHNKWGIPRKQHEEAVTKSLNFEPGLESTSRRDGHRVLTVSKKQLTKIATNNFFFFKHKFEFYFNLVFELNRHEVSCELLPSLFICWSCHPS
jgi:hypothetical protein